LVNQAYADARPLLTRAPLARMSLGARFREDPG
jgi:hypothetical protein